MSDGWDEYAADAEERKPEVGDNMKAVLEGQIKDMWEAEKEVARLDQELKDAKAVLTRIGEEQIPKTFEDMGLDDDSVVSVSGVKVSIKQSVHASPKAARRDEMYDWLEENGHGGLIKRTGVFKTGKDQEKKFKRWIKSIKTYPGNFERKVESATLRAFVNDQLKQGTEIPMDLFGAYTRRVAEIKSTE